MKQEERCLSVQKAEGGEDCGAITKIGLIRGVLCIGKGGPVDGGNIGLNEVGY